MRRAWRRAAVGAHPDKGGARAHYESLQGLRQWLSEPLAYALARARLRRGRWVQFGRRPPRATHSLGGGRAEVRAAAVSFAARSGQPYLRLEVELAVRGPPLSHNASWAAALSGPEGAEVLYHGERSAHGGFDVCCDLVANSSCARVSAPLPEEHLRPALAGDARRRRYAAHDCPLPSAFVAEVTKPLPVPRPGLWHAVLLLREGPDLTEVACVAAAVQWGTAAGLSLAPEAECAAGQGAPAECAAPAAEEEAEAEPGGRGDNGPGSPGEADEDVAALPPARQAQLLEAMAAVLDAVRRAPDDEAALLAMLRRRAGQRPAEYPELAFLLPGGPGGALFDVRLRELRHRGGVAPYSAGQICSPGGDVFFGHGLRHPRALRERRFGDHCRELCSRRRRCSFAAALPDGRCQLSSAEGCTSMVPEAGALIFRRQS
eukprot:TRINITY_DN37917_c0_g1_i1.p1 TRINITY_DN37917_c0_g1~~TRINITY_DN37917_c0_g1_i1.p1  ORF type:complete len:492 (+),score=130.57 TRINITY_DN37917_c0_g1_i1:181-1476(+)